MSKPPQTHLVRWAIAALAVPFVLLALTSTASARCMAHSLSVWPSSGEAIPANEPMIVVRGYGADQESVAALEGQKLELVSGKHRVSVDVVDILESPRRLTQAVYDAVRQ